MVIDSFTILDYGELRSCGLETLSAGMNVFWGSNEAGKSTCLSFFRDMLFGFPALRSKDRSYPLGNGVVGRLTLSTQEGRKIILERLPGPRGGQSILYSEHGEKLPAGILQDVLGGTTREVFQNVFAFSLEELQTLASLHADQVKGVIYSAGLGTRLRSVPHAITVLRQRKEKIFKRKGHVQSINQRLKELVQVEEELLALSDLVERYQELREQEDTLRQSGQQQQDQLDRLSAEYFRLQTVFNLWEEWQEYCLLQDRLARLPVMDFAFPDNGRIYYERLDQSLSSLDSEEQELLSRKAELEERLAGIDLPEELLSQEQAIESLSALAREYSHLWREEQDLQREASAQGQSLKLLLQELGPWGDLERLRALETSIVIRQELTEFKKRFLALYTEQNSKRELIRSKGMEVEELERELGRLELEVKKVEDLLRDMDFAAVSRLQELQGTYLQSDRELQKNRQEEKVLAERLKSQLHDLDPGWQIEDLGQVRLSRDLYVQVSSLEQDCAELRSKDKLLAQETDRLQQELERLNAGLDRHVVQLSAQEARDLEAKIDQLGGDLERYQTLQDELENHLWQAARMRDELVRLTQLAQEAEQGQRYLLLISLVCLGVGILLVLLAVILSRPLSLAVAAVGGIMSFGALALCWRAQKGRTRRRWAGQKAELQTQLQDIEEKAGMLQTELQDLLSVSGATEFSSHECQADAGQQGLLSGTDSGAGGFDWTRGAAVLQGAINDKEKELLAVREAERIRSGLEEERRTLLARMATIAQDRAMVNDVLRAKQKKLSVIADGLGLQVAIQPGMFCLLLERINRAREDLGRLRQLEMRSDYLLGERESFFREVKEIAGFDPWELEQEMLFARLEGFFQEAEEQRRLRQQYHVLQEHMQAKVHALEQKRISLQAMEEDMHALGVQERQLIRNWQAWLDNYGIFTAGTSNTAKPQGLTPDFVCELVQRVERIQELDGRIAGVRQRLGDVQSSLYDIEQKAAELRLGLNMDASHESAPARGPILVEEIRTWHTQLQGARELAAFQNTLLQQVRELDMQMARVQAGKNELQQELKALLDRVGARSGEEFLAREKIYLEHSKIQKRLEQLAQTLCRGLGERDMSTVKKVFSPWTRETLHVRLNGLAGGIREKKDLLQQTLDQLGAVRNELRQLTVSTERSRLRERQEELLAELTTLSRSWARLALAGYLLQRTRDVFEKEHQPQVIVKAAQIFSGLTRGRYREVFAPLGSDSLKVRSVEGELKEPAVLSRGTAEQLYLSLRFAYSDHYASYGRKLPLIMDDILVNFDPQRARRAAMAILEMAQKQQVLFFTCHPHQVEMFLDMEPGVRLYSLQDGQFRSGWSEPEEGRDECQEYRHVAGPGRLQARHP